MITSLTNQKVKDWMKLHTKKGRDETQTFLVEEDHLIEEALKAHAVERIISVQELVGYDVWVELVDQRVMDKLSKNASSVRKIAVCKVVDLVPSRFNRVLLLDGVQDPGNVGTIIRSALAFGYDCIYLSKECADIYNEKCIRASQGAIFKIKCERVDLLDCIVALKKQGFDVIGTSLKQAVSIEKIKASCHMAFVLGNEGQGVSEAVLDVCDQNMIIPIVSFESLNVAIASGIICYNYRGNYDI